MSKLPSRLAEKTTSPRAWETSNESIAAKASVSGLSPCISRPPAMRTSPAGSSATATVRTAPSSESWIASIFGATGTLIQAGGTLFDAVAQLTRRGIRRAIRARMWDAF
jgi:hypothetical protein